MLTLMRLLGSFLIGVTLLPLLSTGKWYVRWWDFPRFQIAVLLAVAVLMATVLWYQEVRIRESLAWIVVLAIAMVWQISHIIPFSPFWWKDVPTIAVSNPSRTFRVMVSNLDKDNPDREPVSDELASEAADVLLLVEYDDAWADRLATLRQTFRYHHDHPRGDGLGMAIWSNLKIVNFETRHLVSERRPSLWTQLETKDGAKFNFVGVHPTPPGLLDETGDTRRDSRVRDAELVMVAQEIAGRESESWVVAGDFNDVAWSHTTRLFKRISGIRDPRIGRSFMGTFMANCPPCRCPIDHIFLSSGFDVDGLVRKRITGSDHFSILATVQLRELRAGVEPKVQGDDRQDAREIIDEGRSDAEARDVLK